MIKDQDTTHLRVKKADRLAFKIIAAKAGKSMQDLFHEWVKAYKGKSK